MKINKEKTLKTALTVLVILLVLYVATDIAQRIRNRIVFQGYSFAIQQLVELAENCEPFDVRTEDKTIFLINIECLQEELEEIHE